MEVLPDDAIVSVPSGLLFNGRYAAHFVVPRHPMRADALLAAILNCNTQAVQHVRAKLGGDFRLAIGTDGQVLAQVISGITMFWTHFCAKVDITSSRPRPQKGDG